MAEHAVVIAGGGPTGLMLAGELALAGVDAVIVERRGRQELEESRSRGMHARTLEVLDQRGIAERFIAAGQPMQISRFAGVLLDISEFPTRHNYGLALMQNEFEQILAGWVAELGVPFLREREIAGFEQDGAGVSVKLAHGEPLRAGYLVGCDGGRSVVRKAAGIEFPGWDASVSSLIAEAEMTEEPGYGMRHDENGTQAIGPLGDGQRVGVVITERYAGQSPDPTLADLRRALVGVWGTDFGVHTPTRLSRFTDMTRQAASYRDGRVLLAGDAAHIHYPVGGQGLNLGVQDAVNLGWKLAQVVKGISPESLLDTYQAERHPVAADALRTTMALTALTRADARIEALRDVVAELLSAEEARTRLAAKTAALDIRYDLGEGHPLLGRRMPDLDVVTADGPARVFDLLHAARPVVLNLGEPGAVDVALWADRVRLVDAGYDGAWELPVLGTVAPPAAVLIRPDGHVAWAGTDGRAGLGDALTTWFGPAA
ncbi:MAG TPA: FAD-dependent monooxygenase [Gaiellales bacterium]|nr:FAD-dependent monooxygenase [Gaiellales bacterium]